MFARPILLREDEVFAGIDDSIDHLVKINSGEIKQDDRWLRINV